MKKSLCFLLIILLIVFFTFGLTACGKDVDFTVKFIVDGEVYSTISTAGNETITMPDNPVKEGHIFDGWYWDENIWQMPFTANSLLDAPLSSDMSIYAKWNTPESLQGAEIGITSFAKTGENEYSNAY